MSYFKWPNLEQNIVENQSNQFSNKECILSQWKRVYAILGVFLAIVIKKSLHTDLKNACQIIFIFL